MILTVKSRLRSMAISNTKFNACKPLLFFGIHFTANYFLSFFSNNATISSSFKVHLFFSSSNNLLYYLGLSHVLSKDYIFSNYLRPASKWVVMLPHLQGNKIKGPFFSSKVLSFSSFRKLSSNPPKRFDLHKIGHMSHKLHLLSISFLFYSHSKKER